MNRNITHLRGLFLDPGNTYRHLAIVHHLFAKSSFLWHNDTTAIPDSETIDYHEKITRRLTRIADMGFGGVVVNAGPDNYLENDEEWEIFLAGVEIARSLGLKIWIYDERGYPSGAAGGIVLRDHPEYEAQGLVRMQQEYEAGEVSLRPPTGWLYNVGAEVVYDGSVEPADLTSNVDRDGYLRFNASRKCIVRRFDARRAFEGTHAALNVYRIRRYINVLNEEAVRYFYKVTEGRYFEHLGDESKHIEAIFTDEPSFMAAYFPDVPAKYRGKIAVQDPAEENFDRLPMIAWDSALTPKFVKQWSYNLILNNLFEGDDMESRRVRHDFYQLQSEVYADAFYRSQQELLDAKGIAFSGHVLAEESIIQHVATEANVMADLKCMKIPGIDMLNSVGEEILDSIRLLTCKYGSSAAHVMGREQVMCEISDWEQQNVGGPTDIRQRMGALAVQMALGITTFTSYYTWKDIPAEEIRNLLDTISRMAVILRNGTHIADAAVLYPIRTAWTYYKPTDQVLTPDVIDEPLRSMDTHLLNISRKLISDGLDFDFIDTRDLIGSSSDNGRLFVANESYPMLIVPPGAVMCPKDIEKTEEFVNGGGRLLAFEPLSDIALDGRSAKDAITGLAGQYPDRARYVSTDGDWLDFAEETSFKDITIDLQGSHLVSRKCVYDGAVFVLIANGSKDDASVQIKVKDGCRLEVWDMTDGSVREKESNAETLRIPGYSALLVASREVE